MAYVEIISAVKAFGNIEVIHDVSLALEKSELTVFVGPSGCGKTTLLRLIAGLETLNSGQINIDGRRIDGLPPSDRGIAMVFQNYALYPHMSVYQNMSFGLRLARHKKEYIDNKVRETADILQITELLDRKPKELSGGQRQRVAIGRAIVREPQVFLFDEPLSNLDAKLRVQMRVELARLHNRLRATMIYVTHDQVEAMTMANKIVVLRDGGVEQVGSPLEIYKHPKNRFVAGFIGSPSMNFLEGQIINTKDNIATVSLNGGQQLHIPYSSNAAVTTGSQVAIGIRPKALTTDETGDASISGKVYAVERLGGETYLYVHMPDGQEITVHVSGDKALSTGEVISIGFRTSQCQLFHQNGESLSVS